jgi:putative ABC transport system permease protein
VAERAQEFAAAIKPKLGPGQRLETIRELRPEVRSTLERSEQFLGLAASFAVFLAVVAIVLALRRYLKRELDTATLFRTLGAGQRQTLMHFVGQFFVLALIACVLGVLLAFAAQAALAWAVRVCSRPLCRRRAGCRWPRLLPPAWCCCSASPFRRWWHWRRRHRCVHCAATCRPLVVVACSPPCSVPWRCWRWC